ncbi:hypothetical protein [Caballeronia sp. GAWG1-1]|uniref:hypothetical protein n=1 Tax=Caballeronia sp. GAWG1-1 TaxID=2921742 RepID=UPI002028C99D|nr:hypothetical protein [Caballeronia sp. GAWG1-1]
MKEETIKGMSESAQETVRGEFESAVADARANHRPLDVPIPQVSDLTIDRVRAEIQREQSQIERDRPKRDLDMTASNRSEQEAPSLKPGI